MRYSFLWGTLLLAGLAASTAQAQLSSTSKAQQRAAKRQALREADRYQAEYKDSHLRVTKAELTPLAGGRQAAAKPTDGRSSYHFDRSGTPRVSEPSRGGLRLRKKKEIGPSQ